MKEFEKLDAAIRLLEEAKSAPENLKGTIKIMINRIKEWTADYCEIQTNTNLFAAFGYIAAYNQFLIFIALENSELVGLIGLCISDGFKMVEDRAKEVKEDA